MDEDKYWEQPQDLVLEENDMSSQNKVEGSQESETLKGEKDLHNEADNGETVGKFKDVNALLEAYENLEKEFTKKCQRLSELEKDKTQEENNLNQEIDTKLKAFLSDNGEATSYSEMLKEKVLNDDSLKKMDDPFSYVWAEMVFDRLKGSNNSDENILTDYIMNNEKIKNMVIENYVNQLTENKSPIKISSSGKRVATSVVTQKPETLSDAKKVLYDLLS